LQKFEDYFIVAQNEIQTSFADFNNQDGWITNSNDFIDDIIGEIEYNFTNVRVPDFQSTDAVLTDYGPDFFIPSSFEGSILFNI
jgi:hypothetical protein